MSLPSLLAGLVRGLELAGLAVVIGGLVLERLGLPAAASSAPLGGQRLRRLISTGVVVLLFATCVDLGLRAQTVSRAPLATAIASIPQLVTHTHFGCTPAAARLACSASRSSSRSARATLARELLPAHRARRRADVVPHRSCGDWGDVTASVAVDWTHAVAASAWTGGLLALGLVVLPREPGPVGELPVPRRMRVALPVSRAMPARVISSGSTTPGPQLGAFSRLWTTAYGRVLLIERWLVVGVLVGLGAINRYVIIPRLVDGPAVDCGRRAFRCRAARGPRPGERRGSAWPLRRSWRRASRGEARSRRRGVRVHRRRSAKPPGPSRAFERKPTCHVTNIQSLAPGSAVSAARGPRAAGRQCSARTRGVRQSSDALPVTRCDGEQFPAGHPAGTESGRRPRASGRQPVESILNPNAMIVDGPGYTDDRGLSIMPEHRHRSPSAS